MAMAALMMADQGAVGPPNIVAIALAIFQIQNPEKDCQRLSLDSKKIAQGKMKMPRVIGKIGIDKGC